MFFIVYISIGLHCFFELVSEPLLSGSHSRVLFIGILVLFMRSPRRDMKVIQMKSPRKHLQSLKSVNKNKSLFVSNNLSSVVAMSSLQLGEKQITLEDLETILFAKTPVSVDPVTEVKVLSDSLVT